ncbi:MAG: ABC transporter substrate-binding protein [Defluviitaleaceae bacterium]|nr:ABC transporter substrate-binding protein [Defluviitaleaceae bacterium]
MKKKLFTLAALAAMTIGVMSFTACGGNDDDAGGQPQGVTGTAGTHSQGVTDTTIYIGNTAATSGAFAAVGVPFNHGLQSYLDIVNAAGGVHGRQIQLVHHDDGFDAVNGLAFTEQLIHDDRIFALVGHFGTPTIGATLPMLKETGIPAVYFAAGISQLYMPYATTVAEGQRLFPVQPLFRPEGHILAARVIDEYAPSTIGVIFSNDEAGQDLISGIRSQVAEIGGVNLVEAQITPADAGSISPAVLTMYAQNVDVIIVATLQGDFPAVVNSIVGQGLNVPVFTSYVSAAPIIIQGFAADYLGANATFPVYVTSWLSIFDDEGELVDDYWAFAEGVGEDMALNTFAMAGWVAASTFVQGLRAMGNVDYVTWEGLTSALEANTVSLPMGGIMDFSNGVRTGTTAMALLRADVDGGEWSPLRGMEQLEDIVNRIN